ncbi:hypothetical protein GF327_04955 [Candidatus Woesearchaeota archaeon]|nr:hypothetical protein [Candidatus Woesearchaeota archaeon]
MKYRNLLILIILSGVILISIHFFRGKSNPYLPGYKTYKHLYNAQRFNNFSGLENPLFFGEKDLNYDLVDFFISLFLEKQLIMKFTPFILGVLSSLIYFLVLKKLNCTEELSFIATVIFSISPVFIYSFSVFNEYFIIAFLTLLSIYLLLTDKYFFSLLIFCMIIIIDLSSLIIPLLILFTYIYNFKPKKSINMIFLFMIISFTLVNVFENNGINIVKFLNFYRNHVTDLGADFGFGIFSIALSLIGLLISWRKKTRFSLYYFVIAILGIYSVYYPGFLIFLEFFLCFFAAIAFIKLKNLKWQLSILKEYALLLIICGLFFSSVSYINRAVSFPPHINEIQSLKWLQNNSDQGSIIFSHYTNGNLIQAVSKRPVITDIEYYESSRDRIRIKDSESIYYSRDLIVTKSLLNKYNISYIWINPVMKNKVWETSDQGLLFLMKNSRIFTNIYLEENIEIWKYHQDRS